MRYQNKLVLWLFISWVFVSSAFAGRNNFGVVMPGRPFELEFPALGAPLTEPDLQPEVLVVNPMDQHRFFLAQMGLTPAELFVADGYMENWQLQNVLIRELGLRAFFALRGVHGDALDVALNRVNELWAQGSTMCEGPWQAWFEAIGLGADLAQVAFQTVCILMHQGIAMDQAYVYAMFSLYGYQGDALATVVNAYWVRVGAGMHAQQCFWYTLYEMAGVPEDVIPWAWQRQQSWMTKEYTMNQAFRVALFEAEGMPPGAAVIAYDHEVAYLCDGHLQHAAHWLAFYQTLQVPTGRLLEAYTMHRLLEQGGALDMQARVLQVIANIYAQDVSDLTSHVQLRRKKAQHPMGFIEALFRQIMYRQSGLSYEEAKPYVDEFCQGAWLTSDFQNTTKRR